MGEPIGTCILAYFVLNEAINFQQGVGIAIIIVGLIIFFLPIKAIVENREISSSLTK